MPRKTIGRLLAGFRGFRSIYYEARPALFNSLREGQHPKVLVIACSDSRVDPANLLNLEPGEAFVVRNVANLVPPYTPDGGLRGMSSALEYAVRDLLVSHVVVLGHQHCGGIGALISMVEGKKMEHRDFLGPWMSMAGDCCSRTLNAMPADADRRARGSAVEQAAISNSLENLMTFPWLAERVHSGDLQLHGWWFGLDDGELQVLDRETGRFAPAKR